MSRTACHCLLVAFAFLAGHMRAGAASPQEVFEKRILPIFRSPDPSSCVQCHLAGVDLKDYILPSHRDTFVSLRDQGLVDLDNPEQSKILRLIDMGKDDRSGPGLIDQKTRQAEYEAFAEWLRASAADPALRDAPKLDKPARPARPDAVIRHARKDRLLASFETNVWSMRFRCMSCHSEGTPQNDKLVREHGEQVAWFKAAGPEATLDALRKGKLIDVREPEKSLLLLKPLNAVKHGGGQKFRVGDQGYKAFRTFIDDYAKIVNGGYRAAADLPKDWGATRQFGTDRWLKLANTPDNWADRYLAVAVYAWDERANGWEKEPVATTDRVVWGKGRLWQHTLNLIAPEGSERAVRWKKEANPTLPPGRYLVKIYVDRQARLVKDWQQSLGDSDYAGQAEVRSDWKPGYDAMTVIDAGQIKK